MKACFSALVLALLSLSLCRPAGAVEETYNLCADGQCTPVMQEIYRQFQTSDHFIAPPLKTVFSGSCYHLASSIDPAHEHYGMAVFETRSVKTAPQTFFAGVFAYFPKSDPYAGMTFDQAVKEVGAPDAPVTYQEHDGYAGFHYDNGTIHYWFSSSTDNNELYLISYWDLKEAKQRTFCRFTRH